MEVLNAHHYKGGVEGLPQNVIYIGRPSKYGNPFSSKNGLLTKEECVAKHRVFLYSSIIENPSLFLEIKHDLLGKDVACWCKHPKRPKACHGDTFKLILSPECINRTYTQSVQAYVIDDLRRALDAFGACVLTHGSRGAFSNLDIGKDELRVEINELRAIFKSRNTDPELICNTLAYITVDLELGAQETEDAFLAYRLDHVQWIIQRFIDGRPDRDGEPTPPVIPPGKLKHKDA